MSQDERVSGRLIECAMTEDEARDRCQELGIQSCYGSWRKTMASETDDYCFINGKLYKIENLHRTYDFYGCKLIKLEDGSISFDAIYYNGGAHWTEVVEDEMEKKGIP